MSDFIQELREHRQTASETIEKAKQEFQDCVVSVHRGASDIIKRWGSSIKNDPAKLELAYNFADENNLISVYTEHLKNNNYHRVCYRTFIVNEYIFSQMKESESDAQAVQDLLDGIMDNDPP